MIKEVWTVYELHQDGDNWDDVRNFHAETDFGWEKCKEFAIKHAKSTGKAVRIDLNVLEINRSGKQCIDSEPDLFGFDPKEELQHG